MNCPAPLYDRIIEAANKHAIDPHLMAAVCYQESRFSLTEIVGDAGESYGPMQLHRRGAGAGRSIHALLDYAVNSDLGAGYLASKIREYPGDTLRAITAYNWPVRAMSPNYHAIGPSDYARTVLRFLAQIDEEGLQRDPPDAPRTPSLLEYIDTIWGALERGDIDVGKGHLLALKEKLGL